MSKSQVTAEASLLGPRPSWTVLATKGEVVLNLRT
jgi:hypothetical protein